MQQIHYDDEPAAAVLPDRFWLVDWIEDLPEEHPTRRWVTALCAYAMRQQQRGEAYEPDVAEIVARELLMPAEEFLPLYGRPEDELTKHFGAPTLQVARRKAELCVDVIVSVDEDIVRRGRGS